MVEVRPDWKPRRAERVAKRLRRRPWRAALGDAVLHERFKREVCASGVCIMAGRSRVSCNGPLQACHVLAKSKLRELGHEAEVVYSPMAGVCACERHHTRSDRGIERFPLAALPPAAFEFAAELGLTYILERQYAE